MTAIDSDPTPPHGIDRPTHMTAGRDAVRIVVYGDPVPQGGTRTVPIRNGDGTPRMTGGKPMMRVISTGGKGLSAWRQEIAEAAQRAVAEHGPFPGAVSVDVVFRLRMPKSRPAGVRKLGVGCCAVRPDGDKLTRAVWDALTTSGLIADDARVSRWSGRKREVWGRWTGVEIFVTDDRLDHIDLEELSC